MGDGPVSALPLLWAGSCSRCTTRGPGGWHRCASSVLVRRTVGWALAKLGASVCQPCADFLVAGQCKRTAVMLQPSVPRTRRPRAESPGFLSGRLQPCGLSSWGRAANRSHQAPAVGGTPLGAGAGGRCLRTMGTFGSSLPWAPWCSFQVPRDCVLCEGVCLRAWVGKSGCRGKMKPWLRRASQAEFPGGSHRRGGGEERNRAGEVAASLVSSSGGHGPGRLY